MAAAQSRESGSGPDDVGVLIVGGSLVGLTTAALLAAHGVKPLVVERHAGTAIHPRAGHFQIRTIEILRELGLEAEVREKARETYDPDGGIIAVESLAGRELARFVPTLNEGVAGRSPTGRIFIDQDVLEPILRRRAEALGAVLRYRTEMTSFEQDADGVTARIRDLESGAERALRAKYLVAADGNRSRVRKALGIEMHGYGLLSKSVTIYFEADCAPYLQGRNSGVFYVSNRLLRGFFRLNRAGQKGFLAINTVGEDVTRDEAVNVSADMSEARALELLRAAIGVPDLAVRVRQIVPWDAEANVAADFRRGRVFLAGDAAHVVPPNGGFGGNTGVQDAHNLAWKLAMVLKGEAGPKLLDTYQAERHPVGVLTVDQAYVRYATRVVPERGTDKVKPFVDDLTIEIGYCYRSAAIVDDGADGVNGASDADDASGGAAVCGHPDELRGRPGTRAPHVVVRRGGDTLSTLDLFGRKFVVLAGPDGDAWSAAAGAAATALGIGLDVYQMGRNFEDVEGRFLERFGLPASGAALVRPDGFVAFRAEDGRAAGASDLLTRALATVLDRRRSL